MRTTAVLDTNALMMPVELGVRVFDELDRLLGAYEAVTPAAVVAELEKLSEGNGEEGTAAAVGRDLVERCTVIETEESYADDAVVAVAKATEGEVYAVTNDRPLRDRLLAAGVDVIGLRGRDTLAITET
ncbi:MAG: PIN domain-containing protein [Halolamina sp.]